MKIEIAQHDRMSESGSSLLRLIQNQEMPLLDLLVRESVQNSLDAAMKGSKFVAVDFRTGTFDYRKLNQKFDKIENRLNAKFSKSKDDQVFIEIRDHNTVGLTGPTKYEDVKDNNFGNLMKLVYEISKPQQNEGSGGSWGLGKTIYFRFGIGLVIYYSRIHDGKKYRSRLAACLVEDETKPNSIIPEDKTGVKRGIAWWGKYTGAIGSEKHSVPIEDEKEINSVLSVFGLKPFSGIQTGTSVIIPYIRSSERINETYSKNEDTNDKPWWVKSIEDYLSVAVQRWYAPRIENTYYKGPYLSASVNDRKIAPENMLPLFRAVRELYIKSIDNDFEGEIIKSSEYCCENICLNNVFSKKSIAGYLAYAKCNTTDLHMMPPDNERSPYQQITNKVLLSDNGNTPIIMFTRKPGMIVGYDFNGTWTHKMPRSSADEYIIGLFRLNSTNEIRSEFSKTIPLSLEEYIRKGEKADHASWADWIVNENSLHIVQNIQKHVNNKITSKFKETKIEYTEKKNIGLGQALAEILLPKTGFGKSAVVPTKAPPKGGAGSVGSRNNKCYFKINDRPEYRSGHITYMFEIGLPHNSCRLDINVITDFKRMNPEKWESDNELGTPFPIVLEEMSILSYKEGKSKEEKCNILLNRNEDSANSDIITIDRIKSERFDVSSGLIIHSKLSGVILVGSITINPSEPCFKGGFEIKEEDRNE